MFASSVGMQNVIIVSKCLGVTQINPEESWYEFHFKGVYAGKSLKKVMLLGKQGLKLICGDEYMMYIQIHSFQNGILNGIILKTATLNDLRDRS
jgi:hypothetical protein